MAYTYDPIFATDPSNAANVAANASITIFDPADETMAPITITDVTDVALPNPITVNKNGFGPAFVATIDRVGWSGAGFTGYFTSYEGMKTVATDAADSAALAQAAAETAGADAAAVAEAALAGAVADAEAAQAAATAAAGLVGAPADSAVETLINTPASATSTALSATIATANAPFLKKKDPTGDMFLGFATSLKNGDESTGLYVIGDSTTTPDTAWFRLLANQVAAEYPVFTSRYWKWNDTTQKFDRPIILNSGGARRAMTMGSDPTLRVGRIMPGANITGTTLEVVINLKSPNYVATQFLASKWTNDTSLSWAWRLNAAGWLDFLPSGDGLGPNVVTCTASPGLTNGVETWLKVQYNGNDGAGNNTTKFWKSTDGIAWTQIGTTVTTAGVRTLFASTSDYTVGSRAASTNPLVAGTEVYELWINDGIDGAPVAPVLPHTWPNTIGIYASTNTGAPELNFVLGAHPGAGIGYDVAQVGYLADPTRLPKLTPDMGQQIAFFNTGHNEGQYGFRSRTKKYMDWVEAVTARMPGVQRIALTQNPRTNTAGPPSAGGIGHKADRARMLSWGRTKDIDVLDVWQAFVADGRPVDVVLVGDGVHPTGEGYLLWKNYVKAELDAALNRVIA